MSQLSGVNSVNSDRRTKNYQRVDVSIDSFKFINPSFKKQEQHRTYLFWRGRGPGEGGGGELG